MKNTVALCAVLLGLLGNLPVRAAESPHATLDALHKAGAEANQSAFFALLADDAVFLGVSGYDRLEGQPLHDFFRNSFSLGMPWAMHSSRREIHLSADGNVAWFDELVQGSSADSGWGSGVLIRDGGGWKVAQYGVSIATQQKISTVQQNVPAAASAPTPADAVTSEAPKKKECRKMRHKTNRVSSC
jgi:hypothetical protein